MKRSEVQIERTWDLSHLVKDIETLESDMQYCISLIKELTALQGKLKEKQIILDCLKKQDELVNIASKVYVYSHMNEDENKADKDRQKITAKADMFIAYLNSELSFVIPELTALPVDFLKELKEDPDFSDFDFMLDKMIRNKKHILSKKEEKILAETGAFSDQFKNTFMMFDNADVKFDSVKTKDGEVKLSHGTYAMLLQNSEQSVRAEAFEKYYASYKSMINTIGTNYMGNVKKDWFYAKTRKFKSSLASALNSEDISVKVYNNLIAAVKRNSKSMHKYIALRKKELKLKELHMYDLYVPLVDEAKLSMDYDKAYSLVMTALAPLGNEYVGLLKSAKEDRWIDVEETENKRSGAYSWGSFGAHPYVLLNYQPITHDVFTIAHEMGHALHSYYSWNNQPHAKAEYEIFVAEVASTVNEVLLLKYLMKDADKQTKKFLLSYYLDMFRTTLFRQTMFSEFEKKAHELFEKELPGTSEELCEIYYELNKQYYGKSVIHDEEIRYEWARVPHFYNSFYVYKYATGITSAVNIAKAILEGKEGALENYKNFLKAGGSDTPLNILKGAGVDLTEKEPFEIAMKEFSDTLAELIAL